MLCYVCSLGHYTFIERYNLECLRGVTYLRGESTRSRGSHVLQIINKGNRAEVLAKAFSTTRKRA